MNIGPHISLSYFAATSGAGPTGSPYDLLLDSARLADEADLAAVWLPERHFSEFGYLYPNPSVAAAAVAAVTHRVGIRAGSVVAPLHHPARVAEEWAVVDQLSGGRVGISFASGWHSNDFVLSTASFGDRRQTMLDTIEAVRALWRGEARRFEDSEHSSIELQTLPRPVQAELPVWLTSGGSPATFELAGTLGANVLTHLVGQSPDDLRRNVAGYRAARRQGAAGRGHVTLMLHTSILDGSLRAIDQATGELSRYLASSMRLDASNRAEPGRAEALGALSAPDRAAVADAAATRFLQVGLVCTADEVQDRLALVRSWDVDEVACLIDFGSDYGSVMKSLDQLLTALT